MVENKQIRFGLEVVRSLGTDTIQEIVKERQANGLYQDFENFVRRNPQVNKAAIENLVNAGAFDNVETAHHIQMITAIPAIQKSAKAETPGQMTLFDIKYEYPQVEERSNSEQVLAQRQAIGHFFGETNLLKYQKLLANMHHNFDTFVGQKNGTDLTMIVTVEQQKEIQTKTGDTMSFVTLTDGAKSIEAVMFPSAHKSLERTEYLIRGKKTKRNDEDQIQIWSATPVEQLQFAVVKLKGDKQAMTKTYREIKSKIIAGNKGNIPVAASDGTKLWLPKTTNLWCKHPESLQGFVSLKSFPELFSQTTYLEK